MASFRSGWEQLLASLGEQDGQDLGGTASGTGSGDGAAASSAKTPNGQVSAGNQLAEKGAPDPKAASAHLPANMRPVLRNDVTPQLQEAVEQNASATSGTIAKPGAAGNDKGSSKSEKNGSKETPSTGQTGVLTPQSAAIVPQNLIGAAPVLVNAEPAAKRAGENASGSAQAGEAGSAVAGSAAGWTAQGALSAAGNSDASSVAGALDGTALHAGGTKAEEGHAGVDAHSLVEAKTGHGLDVHPDLSSDSLHTDAGTTSGSQSTSSPDASAQAAARSAQITVQQTLAGKDHAAPAPSADAASVQAAANDASSASASPVANPSAARVETTASVKAAARTSVGGVAATHAGTYTVHNASAVAHQDQIANQATTHAGTDSTGSVVMRDVPGGTGSSDHQSAAGSSGDGELFGTRDTFSALDSGTAMPKTSWIHANARQAEAGYLDPNLGWIGVRAETTTNGVHAALVAGSSQAAEALAGHVSGVAQYLQENHGTSATVTMAPDWQQQGNGGMSQGNAPDQRGQSHDGGQTSGVSAARVMSTVQAPSSAQAAAVVNSSLGTGSQISVVA